MSSENATISPVDAVDGTGELADPSSSRLLCQASTSHQSQESDHQLHHRHRHHQPSAVYQDPDLDAIHRDLDNFPQLITDPPLDDDEISVKDMGVGCGTAVAAELAALQARAAERAEEFVRKIYQGWKVTAHQHLPNWLQDNDFLLRGHRPQLHSFLACFKSIFRIHTETGNIWTHLLGCIAFICVAIFFSCQPTSHIQWQEKVVFGVFFLGAILCLGFSWLFHTVCCHSEGVGKLFCKLDYCGISFMILGSFVPWLYYSFYCQPYPKITYLVLITVLGTTAIIVSLWDKFATPKYRGIRAGVFLAFGCSGVVPAIHYMIADGSENSVTIAAFGWLVLMAILYILGAFLYACRIPERFFPGKFDIWFQSHQIFHVLVVAAAFVHYHGVSSLAAYRLTFGDCLVSS